MLATGVLTIFGIVSLVSIKATIVDQAAQRLSDNTELKTDVIRKAAENLKIATDVLKKAQALDANLDLETARISAAMGTKLDDLHSMIDQIRDELKRVAKTRKKETVN